MKNDIEKAKTPIENGETANLNVNFNTPENEKQALTEEKRVEMAGEFFLYFKNFLPKDQKFFTYLWIQHHKNKSDSKTIAFDVQREHLTAAQKAIDFNDKGYNVYFGVHLTDKPFGEHERPKKSDITTQVALIADLDCKSAWHVDSDTKKYPTIEQAKNFLPFLPSILVDSGGGLHSYILLNAPIKFSTDDQRKQATERNKHYIEMIRKNAGEFKGAIDGVHDLPRILRLPGTYNVKHGGQNAPLCKVLTYSEKYYDISELDKLIVKPIKTNVEFQPNKAVKKYSVDTDSDFEQARRQAIFDSICVKYLTPDEWFTFISSAKHAGFSYSEVDAKNIQDSAHYDADENLKRWNSAEDSSFGIQNLYNLAVKCGFNEKDFRQQWKQSRRNFDIKKNPVIKSALNKQKESRDYLHILSVPSDSVKERTEFFMANDTTVTDAYISTKEAAKILGVATRSVANWRVRKVFGCPLFSADKKIGNTWYYLRERVEQLKAVYQKGILQSIYKIARKFSDNFQKSDSSVGTEKKEEPADFFTAEEVAEIFGVDESTVRRWREQRIFVEDMLDHFGVYWYAVERVQSFKSIMRTNRRADDSEGNAENTDNTDELNILYDQLHDVDKDIANFETEKTVGIEKIKSAETFDKDSVFENEMLTAAAFAKLYDKKAFSDYKDAIQQTIKEQKLPSYLQEFNAEIKDQCGEIKKSLSDLLARRNKIVARIKSIEFQRENEEFPFDTPEGYAISANGVEKIVGERSVLICRRPVVIYGKSIDTDAKTHKLTLAYLNGKWHKTPSTGAEIIFNARKLIDLAAFGLPVTSVNANLLIDYLDAFKTLNEDILPTNYVVNRCGWHTFHNQETFVEPRRNNSITVDDKTCTVTVANSAYIQSLKTKGNIEEWRKAYELAKDSPVARIIVAAGVAAPLLNVLGERNFVLYVYGKTRGGKSTGLNLAASSVGSSDLIKSFDGTANGIIAAALETNDYAFFVDEKQSADKNLQSQFQRFIYNVANGAERLRSNREGVAKSVRHWRNVTICNGETQLLDDNATGGAFSRLLQIAAPKIILDAETCKQIRDIIKGNYGLILPKVIDKIFEIGFEKLREHYNNICHYFQKHNSDVLSEYLRYLAVLTVADFLLNSILNDDDAVDNLESAMLNGDEIIKLIPTLTEIDDTEREKDFVLGFIAAKAPQFEGSVGYVAGRGETLGKVGENNIYITCRALKAECVNAGFDYKKLVTDLIDAKFVTPASTSKNGSQFAQKKINGVNTRCIKIEKVLIGN